MAFKQGICPVCGHDITIPEEMETAFCPECGASIRADDAFRLAEHPEERPAPSSPAKQPAGEPLQQPVEERRVDAGRPEQPLLSFGSTAPWQQEADTPFLAQWKTDVPFTILGVLLRIMLVWTIINLMGGQEMIRTAMETGTLTPTRGYIIGGGLFDLACAVGAFFVIPKRFFKDYEGRNYLVSFTNALMGGVIFGCWWNSRLTKRRMGISHLVFFVLLATNGLSSITMLMFV